MSRDLTDSINSLVSQLASGNLRVNIMLADSEEVIALKDEIRKLRLDYQRLQEDFNRTEYRYRCESIISQRLLDFCREQRVAVPREMFQFKNDQNK